LGGFKTVSRIRKKLVFFSSDFGEGDCQKKKKKKMFRFLDGNQVFFFVLKCHMTSIFFAEILIGKKVFLSD
jgi:hypothetical protein